MAKSAWKKAFASAVALKSQYFSKIGKTIFFNYNLVVDNMGTGLGKMRRIGFLMRTEKEFQRGLRTVINLNAVIIPYTGGEKHPKGL